jgi:uncharacterized protein with PIN domain
MGQGGPPRAVAPTPRWLADEMLGRLARYLRFLGFDTAYVQSLSDAEIEALLRADPRVLLTRDQALAGRVPGALLLSRTDVEGQLREVYRAFPGLPREVSFDRCTLCNGRLLPWLGGPAWEAALQEGVARAMAEGRAVRVCEACQHPFWLGSHADRLARDVARWLSVVPA